MTTNQDKAADLITELFKDASSNSAGIGKDIVQALEEKGLLAPDLPEPSHDSKDPQFQREYKEECGHSVPSVPDVWCPDPWLSIGVFPDRNEIAICDGGEQLDPFSIAEARKLALALLAAVKHLEERE